MYKIINGKDRYHKGFDLQKNSIIIINKLILKNFNLLIQKIKISTITELYKILKKCNSYC